MSTEKESNKNTDSKSKRSFPPVSTGKIALSCILGYLIPGAGHLLLGRYGRGLVFFLSILAMFGLGLAMRGHIFSFSADDYISDLYSFANVGIGLVYFVCYLLHSALNINIGFGPPQAVAATFEYGNTYLSIAGLLNYLVIMDVYDIAIGRKR